MHTENSWESFKKYWNASSPGDDSALQIESILQAHPFFLQAFSLSKYGFCVIDVKKMEYIYVSSNTNEIAGWGHEDYMKGGIQFAFKVLRPGFHGGLIQFSQLINEYFIKLPTHEKPLYRAYYDYRLDSPTGIKQLLQQDYILRFDEQGHITILLGIAMDVKNFKSDKSMHLRMTNGKENRLYEFEIATQVLSELEPLSDRELEIARQISQSYDSAQIAERLRISLLTVNTHRRNMLNKLKVKDALEMINLLKVLGFV